MSSLNKVQLIGNLCTDVEVRYTSDGKAITNFRLATNEQWKDKNTGAKQSKAEFHQVVLFGRLAEIAGEYLRKGSQVYVEGKLQTRKWQDKQGQDRYTTEVVVDGFNGVMQMLGSQTERQEKNNATQQQPQTDARQAQGGAVQDNGFDDSFDDDLPF